ncbi:MAG TPA: PilN domain-containing protein, partial [Solirubrobacterales bacterium]|nr:PilN domain-containing protein [Solirubrobacterales bacterium]
KDEVAELQAEDAAVSAKAQRLASYTQFRSMSEQRVATVSSLADSRFDWERVMRELALVLPSDTWLTSLTGSAGGETEGGGGGSGLSAGAVGPSLELSGCSAGQEAVAGFVTALKDIDGVTRVGMQSSELPDRASGQAGGEGGDGGGASGDECRTRDFIAKFEIVVAFDGAPVPSAETAPVSSPAETGEGGSSESSESSTDGTEGG